MRVLMTTDTIGGVWTFTRELVTGLLQQHCSVCLVSLGRSPSAEQKSWLDRMGRKWPLFAYECLNVPLEWMENNQEAYHGAERDLLRVARDFGVDLLHSNQFCFGMLPLQRPKVITAHSDVFSWAQCCREGELEPSPWLERYTWLIKNGLGQASVVAAPTRWMAENLAGRFQLPQEPVVIPNGRRLPAPTKVERKLQAVTAGRLWDDAKDIPLLADVDSPIPILIAGEVQNESTVCGTVGNAVLCGALSSFRLLRLFRESSIYICTSKYEPFGLAPLEAALCGCAVLARDIPPLREVWESGALYFTDAASLRQHLCRLAKDPQELERAQVRSLQRARTYSTSRMASQYRQLYRYATHSSKDHAYVA